MKRPSTPFTPHALAVVLRPAVFGAATMAGLLGLGSGVALAQSQGAGASAIRALNGGTTPIIHASVKSRNAASANTAPVASAKPSLVATYGDWGAYLSQGAKSKICYALAQPKDRAPSSIKKDAAYIFISDRPGEGVHNEVSIIMGLPLKDGASGGRADLGATGFDLVAKGQNAFIKNAADEGQFVEALKRRGARLVIKTPTAKGAVVADTYSLNGIAQALDRIGKECR